MPESAETPGRSASEHCATEPIHLPGGIQPHGYLFSLDSEGNVIQVSGNVTDLVAEPVERVLGRPLSDFVGELAALVQKTLDAAGDDGIALHVGTLPVLPGLGERQARGPLAVVVHRYDGVRIVELEPAGGTDDVFSSIYPLVRTFISQLQGADSLETLASLAVREVHRIAGMGRTMLYRFDEEGHGHVLAEVAAPGYPTYLDHRFPASDIPAQARALYVSNRIRLIADASYVPAPLVPARHPETGRPTDLTFASLRSVSPVHVQYMKNMGTWASMSMSIVVQGRLWGLISCHHAEAALPAFEMRAACEHIAQILSLQIETNEKQAQANYRLALRKHQSRLLAAMANTEDFVEALTLETPLLLRLANATGAAVVFEGRLVLLGAAPPEADVERLVTWLDNVADDVFETDRLVDHWDGADGLQADCAGILVASISRLFRNYVIWFRPEVVRTIRWAGEPRTKLSGFAQSMSPRESFESWTQTVSGKSLPWHPAEVEIAHEFRTAMLGIVLKRAEALAQIAMELGRANRELEGFSYTVSHDLRAPLRHIVGFADLLGQMEGDRLSERGKHFLARILAQARFGGRLVDDLLSFAQMGRAALRPRPVDLGVLTATLVAEEEAAVTDRNIEWQIDLLPASVHVDPVLIHIVMQNLIANAVKFTGQSDPARIGVRCRPGTGALAEFDVVSVSDNGVGFDMRYVDKLFGVFQRLHRSEDFPGTGIGLATVQRIIERHGGATWAEGELGRGATFSFSLPRRPATEFAADSPAGETAARLVEGSRESGFNPVLKDTR